MVVVDAPISTWGPLFIPNQTSVLSEEAPDVSDALDVSDAP